jgi:ABC-type hemin transport system ATPase subunit
LKKLITDVTSINSSIDVKFQKGVMNIVRELFTAAVKLAFIDINLIMNYIEFQLIFIKIVLFKIY